MEKKEFNMSIIFLQTKSKGGAYMNNNCILEIEHVINLITNQKELYLDLLK